MYVCMWTAVVMKSYVCICIHTHEHKCTPGENAKNWGSLRLNKRPLSSPISLLESLGTLSYIQQRYHGIQRACRGLRLLAPLNIQRKPLALKSAETHHGFHSKTAIWRRLEIITSSLIIPIVLLHWLSFVLRLSVAQKSRNNFIGT